MVRLALLAVALAAVPDEWSEFQALARDKDPDKRIQAIEKIKAHADVRMVQFILPLAGDEHPRVRSRATSALSRVTNGDAVALVVRAGLRHPSPLIRLHSAEALGFLKRPESVAPLVTALADGDPDVRAAAATALAFGAEALEALEKVLARDPAWKARAMALESISKIHPARATELAEKTIRDGAYQVRLMTALIAPSAAILAIALGDSEWRVRVQAMESACRLREASLIGPLIEWFEKERGRLKLDLYYALRDLTGKELGLEAAPWKRWWDVVRDTFQVPAAAGAPAEAPIPVGTGAHFFNLPILTTKMTFLLDLSGSMRDPAPGGTGETKLDLVKRQTAATIKSLTDVCHINIVGLGCAGDGKYARDQKRWKKTLFPATGQGRHDAVAFVMRQEAHGWTNIWDGLELAFDDDAVDTVFLYTDGGASRGVYVTTDEILAELADLNRFRKVMVHTIEAAADKPNTKDNIRLMKEIAARTKGTYRVAK